LLKELGFLSNGDVVSKTASDFVGQHVGESQTKTSAILEGAKGKVLIIDECYALDDDLFGKQVLDTIVEKVHGSPAEDIAVLLLGYEEQVLKMMTKQNPGLTRRFPKEQAFYFDDYDDNELLNIMDLNLKKNEVTATMEFREKALEVLQAQRAQTNFGNAGSAELVVKGAILKAAKRDANAKTMLLDACDIDDPGSARADKDDDPLSSLDKLYKMEEVKSKLDKMRKTWAVAKQDGDDRPNLGHFVFTGSPGTGGFCLIVGTENVLTGILC
jgi:Cdc6-like AAA superfamily ATPase